MALNEDNDSIRSIANVLRLWRYFMVLPKYVYDPKVQKFKYVEEKCRMMFCTTWFLLNLFGILLCEEFHRTNLEVMLSWGYKACVFVNTWVVIISMYRRSDDIEELIGNLIVLDIHEEYIFGRKMPRKKYELVWMKFIIFLFMIFILVELLMDYYIFNTKEAIFLIILFYFQYILHLQIQQFLITFQMIIYHHFEMRNFALQMLELPYHRTKYLAEYYNAICSTFTDFKKIFSLAIIMKCFYAFNTILLNVMSELVIELYSDSILIHYAMQIFIISCFSVEIVMVLTLVWINVETEKQNNCAIANIYDRGMKTRPQNLSYKSMELFLLDSKLNQVKFSICGFFNFDWTLIYSMVAGLTTYSVYLIQFREMESNRSY